MHNQKSLQRTGACMAFLALLLTVTTLFSLFATGVQAAGVLSEQVVSAGGQTQNSADGITVSKTIAQVEGLENVFDITLRVESRQSVVEIATESDAAIVVVMDISNTMNDPYGGTTRYDAAMEAVNGPDQFIDQFAGLQSKLSQIGYVAFNTNAHMIAPMQHCYTEGMAATLKSTIASETDKIIHASGYAAAHSRFTNVEAGLALAKDMLDGVTNENKYIVLLSDGFPTTYLDTSASGYQGYDPYTPKASSSTDGNFYDEIRGVPCSYGTSYSDRAAIRAREMATAIKSDGTEIYTIGIDVGGQTIQKHIDSYVGKAFSVVDVQDHEGFTQYELGSTTDTGAFKGWLKNSIGSGHYYDSTNSAELQAAFHSIFDSIQEKSQMSETLWQVTDPMNAAQTNEHIDFLQFFEKDGATLHAGNLSGQAVENGENTATFDAAKGAIQWDLKASGYQVTASGSGAVYIYELKYRVRLENERPGFASMDNQPIDSNGRTTVTYKVREESNGNLSLSEDRELEFKIPQIKGYVADLEFAKRDHKTGEALPGVSFSLTHDDAACQVCKLTGVDKVPGSMLAAETVAVSDSQGTVSFRNIPSGHIYTLREKEAADHYIPSSKAYTLEVSYDAVLLWDGETLLEAPYVFTNVRKNSVTIEKLVEGDKTKENTTFQEGSFLFRLLCEGQVRGEVALPKADGTWTHTFEDLEDGQYTLTEQNMKDPVDGYTCKTTFCVDGGQAADACDITLNGGDLANVQVINTYTKPEPAKVVLAGKKILEGKTLEEGMFSFQLYASDASGTQGQLLETVTHDAQGNFAFFVLTYEEVGVHYYLVKEENGGTLVEGLQYSDAVYLVTVTVSKNADGSFAAEVKLAKDGAEAALEFVNTYTKPEPARVTLAGVKTLEGKTLEEGMFSFQLYASDTSGTQGQLLETVTHDAQGNFAFSVLTYEEVGVHYYLVKEENGGTLVEGLQYSDAVYLVTVTVSKNADGSFAAEVKLAKDGAEAALEFVNTLKLDPTSPETGDSFQPVLWVCVMVAAIVCTAAMGYKGRKKA